MNDCMISDKLWIDFKLYFYVRIHKDFSNNALTLGVVNWFQIVFLREDSQVVNIEYFCILGCELISNCIFTWGFTRFKSYAIPCLLLWIDFKLYFYVRIHKYVRRHSRHRFVVNWFQIVFLREDSQEKPKNLWQHNSCELISNCIFTWGFTRTVLTKVMLKALWIDFKLYFYVRIHKGMSPHVMSLIVVNWFQIVFLREDSQAKHYTIHGTSVVNWFQIVFLREDSQVLLTIKYLNYGCELISNCIFTWGFTSSTQ